MEKEKEVASNNDMRFMMDLEFVELLSNPFYLQNLAQSRVFDDQAFLNYVDYLQVQCNEGRGGERGRRRGGGGGGTVSSFLN